MDVCAIRSAMLYVLLQLSGDTTTIRLGDMENILRTYYIKTISL